MNTDNFFQSKLFKGIILGLAAFMILMLVFSLGIFVGARRADFSFRWAESYHRNFAGPKEGFLNDFIGDEFMDANGVFGIILKIDGQTLTIKDKDNVERIVLVNEKTTIRYLKEDEELSDLKINDNIVVIGEPNSSGQIEASLIRVMPPMPRNPSRVPFHGFPES